MNNPIAPLLGADEQFIHQHTDTFAAPASTDLSWTEKVCAMAMARDGSLQIGFGLGKYANRNVMDGYAALSIGARQYTVRASRRLAAAPEQTAVGPLHYEIVEPMRQVRFRLEKNDAQPIAFDWLFEAALPPFLEDRTHLRQEYRLASDLVRYHQTGVASGWIECEGQRTEIDPQSWVSTRDHSWGVRYDVGQPPADLQPGLGLPEGASFMMIWCPILMQRKDGGRYGLHLHFTRVRMAGFEQKMVTARVERPDSGEQRMVDIEPRLRFDPQNRRLLGGELHCTMEDGASRLLQLETLGDTGVHLGAGLYFGFDGHHHGEWRGELHVEGERIDDCRTPEQARRLHQIRDTAVRVLDASEDAEGWGNCQPIVYGPWPELGLDAEFWM